MKTGIRAIDAALEPFANARLSIGRTPIHQLPRLSADLGRELYVMREDLTGFGLGGNKVRKLDYLVGDALAHGIECLVTTGESSFSRNLAAAGSVHGLEVHVVIPSDGSAPNQRSRAWFQNCGTNLHPAALDDTEAERRRVVRHAEARGRRVMTLHPGGSDEVGMRGYLEAFGHIAAFSAESGIHFEHIVVATGSTATQVGLVLGQHLTGWKTSIAGIAISQPREVQHGRVTALLERSAASIGWPAPADLVVVDDRFLGAGYARPTAESLHAAEVFFRQEALALDAVYTAKAAAGFLQLAAEPRTGGGPMLFVHTGGNADLYASATGPAVGPTGTV